MLAYTGRSATPGSARFFEQLRTAAVQEDRRRFSGVSRSYQLALICNVSEFEFCRAVLAAVRLHCEADPHLGADGEDLMGLFHRHQTLWTAILAGDRPEALQVMNDALDQMLDPNAVGDRTHTPIGSDRALR